MNRNIIFTVSDAILALDKSGYRTPQVRQAVFDEDGAERQAAVEFDAQALQDIPGHARVEQGKCFPSFACGVLPVGVPPVSEPLFVAQPLTLRRGGSDVEFEAAVLQKGSE
jgi:hypothetical protein